MQGGEGCSSDSKDLFRDATGISEMVNGFMLEV